MLHWKDNMYRPFQTPNGNPPHHQSYRHHRPYPLSSYHLYHQPPHHHYPPHHGVPALSQSLPRPQPHHVTAQPQRTPASSPLKKSDGPIHQSQKRARQCKWKQASRQKAKALSNKTCGNTNCHKLPIYLVPGDKANFQRALKIARKNARIAQDKWSEKHPSRPKPAARYSKEGNKAVMSQIGNEDPILFIVPSVLDQCGYKDTDKFIVLENEKRAQSFAEFDQELGACFTDFRESLEKTLSQRPHQYAMEKILSDTMPMNRAFAAGVANLQKERFEYGMVFDQHNDKLGVGDMVAFCPLAASSWTFVRVPCVMEIQPGKDAFANGHDFVGNNLKNIDALAEFREWEKQLNGDACRQLLKDLRNFKDEISKENGNKKFRVLVFRLDADLDECLVFAAHKFTHGSVIRKQPMLRCLVILHFLMKG